MKNKIYSQEFSNKMSAKTTQKLTTLEKKLSEFLNSEQVEQVLELFKSQKLRKRAKTVKDPNAPKRWTSNYIFFCNERRKQLVSKFPEASATEITVKLGTAWKALSDAEKQKYTDISLKDKERYQRELAVYTAENESKTDAAPVETKTTRKRATKSSSAASHASLATQPESKVPISKLESVPEKKTTTRSKKEVEPEPPTRKVVKKAERTPGFRNFSSETREEVESEHPELSQKKVDDELLRRWNKLPEDQREVYEVTAENDEEDL